MDWLAVITNAISPGVFIYLLMGVVVGMFVGALPGLTATMAIALLTPVTFWLDPSQGFAMLIGVYNAAVFAGGISAILVNTPGTPASIASTFDGYEITKRGQPGLALGINTIFSAMGGIFSTIILTVAAFPVAKFALQFGPPEYFLLAIFGLSMMISVSQKSVLKGLIVGVFGMLISTIGIDPMLATKRFVFGNTELIDGISFLPVMIGLFGIGEILFQISEKRADVKKNVDFEKLKKMGRFLPTVDEFKRLIPCTSMSAIVGVFVGAVPGTGGDIASIICWDQAKKMSKKPEEFGKGSLEGLATTCMANNSSIGGALTTMLTLGIPGDAVTAVLIGSLMMYGMTPGPRLFIDNPGFIHKIVVFMFLANIIFLCLGLFTSKLSIHLLRIKDEAIWLTVSILSVVGSFALRTSYLDVISVVAAGVVGFIFRKMDFPLGPMILALLLGRFCESNMRRALALSQGSYAVFFTRPISIILILLIIASLVVSAIQMSKQKQSSASNLEAPTN
jgi:putative tricarboxylic transport membrane protein